jgi:hypothetical protein
MNFGIAIKISDDGFAFRYPLGTTRWRWAEVDGRFVSRENNTVAFNVKPEWKPSHSRLIRRAMNTSQRTLSADVRMRAGDFGMSSDDLAALLNKVLDAHVGDQGEAGSPSSDVPTKGPDAPPSPRWLKFQRRFLNVTIAVVLVIYLIARFAH